MHSWQNGTRCRDGVKGHSHLVWLQNCAKIKKVQFYLHKLIRIPNIPRTGGVQINRVFVRGINRRKTRASFRH